MEDAVHGAAPGRGRYPRRRRGPSRIADVAGITSGGRLAHLLKDAIEWEYRQSVSHLRGWDPAA